jgi:hypothetical protein
MSNKQSSKVAQPCDGSFDCPSSAITPKLASVLSLSSFSTFAMGTNQIPLRLLEPFTKRITIVSTVGNQRDRTVFWTGGLDKHTFDELASAWDAFAVEHAKGVPWPSATTIHLVPFPRLVFPTSKPLFKQEQNSHRQTLRPNPVVLADRVGPKKSIMFQ